MLSFKDRSNWTPAQARNQFRQNFFPAVPTGGIASRFAQVSVHMMPSSAAEAFVEFCRKNNAPCPVIYQSRPGEVSAPPIAANCDIRTDQTMYGVFENGVCTRSVPDILDIPFDDFVCFHLGCSHSFENALTTAGLPVRHQQANRSVPSYSTKIPCYPSGPFQGNLVVSMRPMPRNLVERAAEVTAVLEPVHGAPVHIGHPCWLGIKDLSHPEYDDPPNIKEGDVLLYWGCGTTATEALTAAKLPLLVSISPTANCCNFITDLENEVFCKLHAPEHGSLLPKVRFISERPLFGSLVSDKALEQIEHLEKLVQQVLPAAVEPDEPVEKADSLVKAAMKLSHASSVAIVTLNDSCSSEGSSVLSITKAAMATGNKNVVLLVPESKLTEWEDVITRCVDVGILKTSVRVIQLAQEEGSSDILEISRRTLSNMDEFKVEGVCPLKYTALVGPGKQGGHWVTCAAELMSEWGVNHVTSITDPGWPGDAVAAAMYILNCCPIHSRYLRRGLGLYKPLESAKFMMRLEELEALRGSFTSGSGEDITNKINAVVSSSSKNISSCMQQAQA